MNTAVATRPAPAPYFTPDQIDLLKSQIAKDATDDELKLFVYVCERTGLDPFARQIHFVKRSGKMVIQTGIDGFRVIAHRTGICAGIEDAVYGDPIQVGNVQVPGLASVTVWRIVGGQRQPFTASARWKEYAPDVSRGEGFMWKKMPYLMLGKVAESLALRKSFPQELSGLYVDEEMHQADPPRTVAVEVEERGSPGRVVPDAVPSVKPVPPPEPQAQQTPPGDAGREEPPSAKSQVAKATEAQLKALSTMATKAGWTDEEKHQRAGVASLKELSKSQASNLIDAWQNVGAGGAPPAPTGEGASVSSPEPSQRVKAGTTPNLAGLTDALREKVLAKFSGNVKGAENYLASVSKLVNLAGTWDMPPEELKKIDEEMSQ